MLPLLQVSEWSDPWWPEISDMGGFTLEEIQGDLFSAGSPPLSLPCPQRSGRPESDVALAHCISADVRMGKGIAVAFKAKFGGVASLKRQVAEGSLSPPALKF